MADRRMGSAPGWARPADVGAGSRGPAAVLCSLGIIARGDWIRGALARGSLRFIAFSALSLAINLGVTTGLKELADVPGAVGFAVALAIATLVNFTGLRLFVYQSTGTGIVRQFASFVSASFGFRCAEYAGFLALQSVSGLSDALVVLIVLSSSFVVKFHLYEKLVFRSK